MRYLVPVILLLYTCIGKAQNNISIAVGMGYDINLNTSPLSANGGNLKFNLTPVFEDGKHFLMTVPVTFCTQTINLHGAWNDMVLWGTDLGNGLYKKTYIEKREVRYRYLGFGFLPGMQFRFGKNNAFFFSGGMQFDIGSVKTMRLKGTTTYYHFESADSTLIYVEDKSEPYDEKVVYRSSASDIFFAGQLGARIGMGRSFALQPAFIFRRAFLFQSLNEGSDHIKMDLGFSLSIVYRLSSKTRN